MASLVLMPVFHCAMELPLHWSKDGTTEQLQKENKQKINAVYVVSDKHQDLFLQILYKNVKKRTYPRCQVLRLMAASRIRP